MLKTPKFNLIVFFCLTICFISCENATESSNNKAAPKKIAVPIKTKKKKKTKKVKLTPYWLAAKKELKLSNQEITQLRKVRSDYSKQIAKAKNQKQKDTFLKQRSAKEVKILGSVKKKKAFNDFNKKWKLKNGK